MKLTIISLASLLLFFQGTLPEGEPIKIPAGTPVTLELIENVNSDEVQIGHPVKFMVRRDVVVDGKVVIRTGDMAEGWVKDVLPTCPRRCNRRCASLTITARTVRTVSGQVIYLRSIPHEVKDKCCCNQPAVAKVGTVVRAYVLNNARIQL